MNSIVIALPKIEDAKKIKAVLVQRGFPVAAICNRGASALEFMSQLDGGVLICGCKLPDMSAITMIEYFPKHFKLLFLGSDTALMQIPSGYLSVRTPLRIVDLVNTVDMLLVQIARERKRAKARPKPRSEREQNYISNAKMILMQRNHLTEEEAFRYIQKSSMDSGTNMVETAQMILMLLLEET